MGRKKENLTERVLKYVKKTYGTVPDHPWRRDPESMVLRHTDTKKWYGLIMKAERTRLGVKYVCRKG